MHILTRKNGAVSGRLAASLAITRGAGARWRAATLAKPLQLQPRDVNLVKSSLEGPMLNSHTECLSKITLWDYSLLRTCAVKMTVG